MNTIAMPAPGLRPIDLMMADEVGQGGQGGTPKATSNKAKAHAEAQDFEAVFLNSMFQQMYTGIDGAGPFGGKGAGGVWRSFLTQAYSKSFAQSGGIGIAADVYKTLLGQQEVSQ